MLATANFGEDSVLLDLLIESPKGTFESFPFTDFNFGHGLESPPSFASRRFPP